MANTHPEWATKFRTPGTELRFIKGKYYLYEYKTVYDAEKKRPKKISGKLIGRITQEQGLVSGKKQKLTEELQKAKKVTVGSTREYGASKFIIKHFLSHFEDLEKYFPNQWKIIIAGAYCRLLFQAPIKRMPLMIANSWLSEHFNLRSLSDKYISTSLNEIGKQRNKIIEFLNSRINPGEFILADTTHILSKSDKINLSQKGYNNHMDYEPQINLMYLYSLESRMPVFYRLHAGNIREIKAFKLTVQEAGLNNVTVIADKGFYSQNNMLMLDESNLKYILPLKRNNNLIDYSKFENNTIKRTKNYFNYQQRIIWYSTIEIQDGKKLTLFLDEHLKQKEERDYLLRIESHPENFTIETFNKTYMRFGTFAVIDNLNLDSPEIIYKYYKSRMNIEEMFDTLKNYLDADSTYMQNEDTLQGWMLLNHIALQWYHLTYQMMAKAGMTSKYSVKDIYEHLTRIRRVQLNDQWYDSEITTSTSKILLKLEI